MTPSLPRERNPATADVRLPHISVPGPRKIGPFRVKRRTGEHQLPAHIKSHPIISCVHLEAALPNEDRRHQPPPPPVQVNSEERFITTSRNMTAHILPLNELLRAFNKERRVR
jgi:hypothetical protein